MPPPGFDDLTAEEQRAYIDELARRSAEATVHEEHLTEVRRRQAADRQHPESRRPWREAMRDIRASRE